MQSSNTGWCNNEWAEHGVKELLTGNMKFWAVVITKDTGGLNS